MARVTSQYPQLDGGVSQRSERLLRTRQVRRQVNMVFDPVMGLTRRPGTTLRHQGAAPGGVWAGGTHRVFSTLIDGVPLSVHYKHTPSSSAGAVLVVNDSTGALTAATAKAGDSMAAAVESSGVAAMTALGDLVVMAPNGTVPTYSTTYPWARESNQRQHVVWVRGGAYSRAFTLTVIRGNQKCRVQYTTLEASYPKVLDTSDLLPTDPDYSKKVNDRTNAYNSEATAWIAAALADITPENIATKLARGLEQSGFLSVGATVTVSGSHIFIDDPGVEEVEADDAGDGNLIRAAGNLIGAPELLTVSALPGKIVKVRPGNSDTGQVFYLQARAKDGGTDYTAVTWEEVAGEVTTPTAMFVYMAKKADGSYVYSSDMSWINAQTGRSFRGPVANVAGDAASNPPPEFFGQEVTALAVFQDRLLVCRKDGYVAMSRVGDYFNFFRQSAVTVVDTDPVAYFITSAVGDTVRSTLTYNSNLLLVGDSRQYALASGTTVTPSRPGGAAPFSSVPGMVAPRLVGDTVFFVRGHNGYGSAHALRPGRVIESAYEVEATSEVNTLIPETPADIVVSATPDVVFLRTSDRLFVVDYQHTEGGERYAVHEWTFPGAGTLVSATAYAGKLLLVFARDGNLVTESLALQVTAPGAQAPVCADLWDAANLTGREYPSEVTLVSPRLSPEAGNITGTGLGAEGFSPQRLTVATMIPFFTSTAAVTLTVEGPDDGARSTTFYPKVPE